MIDEKEVQVSDANIENDMLSDYLVPPGSTATIACELELSQTDLKQLVWQKDEKPVELGGKSKFQYVVSGPKHFLIIHNAQPENSGIYSVLINNVVFKIAQLTVGEGEKLLSGSRLKHISNSSICI
jgi:hypothetical protein